MRDVYTGDDPSAAGGRFEHWNESPEHWGGLLVCISSRPQLVCTCGHYRLHWDEHLPPGEEGTP